MRQKNGSGLSNTEALVREGINPPGPRLAPLHFRENGADDAVRGPVPGQFRRETNAGGEGMAGVKVELERGRK